MKRLLFDEVFHPVPCGQSLFASWYKDAGGRGLSLCGDAVRRLAGIGCDQPVRVRAWAGGHGQQLKVSFGETYPKIRVAGAGYLLVGETKAVAIDLIDRFGQVGFSITREDETWGW